MVKQLSRFSIPLALIGALFVALMLYMTGVEAQQDDGGGPLPASQVEDAPQIQLPADTVVQLNAGFDEQPTDWELQHHTLYTPEFGTWASDSSKLSQNGAQDGTSFEQTMLLTPVEVGNRALASLQVYPQGNRVVGMVFGATDEGYYNFRAFGRVDTPEPTLNFDLKYYDATTDSYRAIAEELNMPGYELYRWQEIRVVMDENIITCYFDGEKIFEVQEDEPLPAGRAGAYTIALGNVLFDNFILAELK